MTNIYVGNLAYNTTEDELRTAFEEYGQVSSVSIVKDRETGRSRGFAFVEMPDGQQAKQAIEALNLSSVGGRSVTVNEARPRSPKGPNRGGGKGRRW
jgi:RNA recognition motif-containing protein